MNDGAAVYTGGDLSKKCYSCGCCVTRCSQGANRIRSSIEAVLGLLSVEIVRL